MSKKKYLALLSACMTLGALNVAYVADAKETELTFFFDGYEEQKEEKLQYSLDLGQSYLAKVNASTPKDVELSYLWYNINADGTVTPIDGETSPILAISQPGEYMCEISDETTIKNAFISVNVKTIVLDYISGLSGTFDAEQPGIATLLFGSDKTFTVTAHSLVEKPIAYAWYMGEELISETNALTITKAGEYTCKLSDGDYEIVYPISVTNEYQLNIDESGTHVTAPLGDYITFVPSFKKPSKTHIDYQWYTKDSQTGEKELIKGAQGETYTIKSSLTMAEIFTLELTVGGTYKAEIDFYPFVEAAITKFDPGQLFFSKADKTLKVDVETPYGEYLKIQWYVIGKETEGESLTPIEGANNITFTVPKSNIADGYTCIVSVGSTKLRADYMNKIMYFTDVKSGSYYTPAVKFLYERNVMTGYTEDLFGVDHLLSREDMVTILWKMEGRPDILTNKKVFSDVGVNKYYSKAVAWAKDNEIVTGYTSGKRAGQFGQGDDITRQDFVKVLYSYAKFKGYNTMVKSSSKYLEKKDADQVARYAIDAVNWAYENEFIGQNSDLKPTENITRQDAAVVIERFLKEYVY